MTNNDHHLSFGCHVADSDVAPGLCVNRRKEGGGCTYSPDVDGDDVVRLCRRCRDREGQRVVMGRDEEGWEKMGCCDGFT